MSNLISSDFFRVRKGAALRNTFIGAALIVILLVSLALMMSAESISTNIPGAEHMTVSDQAELQQDIQNAQQEALPVKQGADLASMVLSESFLIMLFLPICIAVFCADFSAGTYRNTLSYESNRLKVYMAKFFLSVILSFALVLATVLFSWLVGGVLFGIGGFTGAYFVKIFTTILLQTPLLLATVATCHFLIAITKKSSSTIAVFLVGFILLAMALQFLTIAFPELGWLMLLEPQSAGKIMAGYEHAAASDLLFIGGYNLLVTAVATVLGVLHYRKVDMP